MLREQRLSARWNFPQIAVGVRAFEWVQFFYS